MIRMSDADFDRAVEAALAEIPDEFRPHLDNVMVEVQPRPDRLLMQHYQVPGDILGLYVGTPLDERHVDGPGALLPDRVLIFRDNLCAMCANAEQLAEEIRITVLHEIGHHFGMDEDELEDLGYG